MSDHPEQSSLAITDAQKILKHTFGYDHFRDGQAQVIAQVLQQKDVLVLMPTGGGKSLCYQIPAMLLPGLTIVISPLISLMKDQVDALLTYGVNAAYINSNLSAQEMLDVYRGMQDGKYRLIYVAPERLMQLEFIHRLQGLTISLIAVDEAHCVSHWGHDFRKDYRLLGQLKATFPYVPIMGLTATADLATRADITQQLNLQQPFIFKGSFDRPNIRYNQVTKYKATDQAIAFVKQQEGSGIIYCNSRKKVDDLSIALAKSGVNCAGYHAGLEGEIRDKIQRDFIQDKIDVIVATVAFGMGIDKSNVRFVLHFDLPRSIESYYQEIGRAGRDGMPAEALLLFDEKDAARIRQWISTGENVQRNNVELQKFAAMEAFGEAQTCRRQILLNYFAEYSAGHCGNCDICLDPPKAFDGTVDAQKVLSCVFRLKQSVASQYLIDVLRGKQLKRILENGHDKLSTFSIGKEKSDAFWHNVINQLIHRGFLRVDITQNAVLKLTEEARPILQQAQNLQLAVPRLSLDLGKKSQIAVQDYDRALFAKLKHLRKRIAEQDDVPPFVVFSDATLADMADKCPESEFDFLDIHGVGQTKLERYGERFIAAISKHLTRP
ncbi:DNA helicase RecQ [Paraglaciecola arctica]|uniref:DNA helicase RecQ n=1 Tax=Paraglaciecola arctica TaxID=1128911 RepID=UPI001C06BF2C|nr:DNA helicase RecQ [Paraglaciecola arctica]MBU3005099.1 DNA helicase RecQ [Paraglaciecola arctica]